jgi:hypothetical protein
MHFVRDGGCPGFPVLNFPPEMEFETFSGDFSSGDLWLGTSSRTRRPVFGGANMSRGETPTLGVKLWIEPRKRKWSTNSARSSKALASSW